MTAATTSPCHLHVAADVLLVEEMKGRQTHIGDFFLAEGDGMGRRELEFLGCVESRGGRR
jgi:hypothetical protein